MKVYVYPPVHPLMLAIYIMLSLPLIVLAGSFYVAVLRSLGFTPIVAQLLLYLVALSPLLSMVNIHVAEIATGRYRVELVEKGFIKFYGFYIPIVAPRLVEDRVVLAINLGGAVIPLSASAMIIYGIARTEPAAVAALVIPVAVTTIATYAAAEPIPHAGIGVPMLIPPLTAAMTSLIVFGSSPVLAVASAYVSAVLGSLIGADIVKLRESISLFTTTHGPAILSIGGAGTFDGIYVSGVLAVVLSLLLI